MGCRRPRTRRSPDAVAVPMRRTITPVGPWRGWVAVERQPLVAGPPLGAGFGVDRQRAEGDVGAAVPARDLGARAAASADTGRATNCSSPWLVRSGRRLAGVNDWHEGGPRATSTAPPSQLAIRSQAA